jgi:hypothetical protein
MRRVHASPHGGDGGGRSRWQLGVKRPRLVVVVLAATSQVCGVPHEQVQRLVAEQIREVHGVQRRCGGVHGVAPAIGTSACNDDVALLLMLFKTVFSMTTML